MGGPALPPGKQLQGLSSLAASSYSASPPHLKSRAFSKKSAIRNPKSAIKSSTRRPRHLPFCEQMYVEVRHRLARVLTVVHDQAEAVGELELFRDEAGDEEKMPEQCLIRSGRLTDAGNHFLRYDEKMDGRLRLHVVQDDAMFVLVLDPARNLAVDDLLKDGFHAVVRSE